MDAAAIEAIVEEMEHGDGLHRVDGFLSIETCRSIIDIASRYKPDDRGNIRCLLDKIPVLSDIIADEYLMAICDVVFGPHFRLATLDVRPVRPGEGRESIHKGVMKPHLDYPHGQIAGAMPNEFKKYISAPLGMQVFIALDDLTLANGATSFMPGSQKLPGRPDTADFEAVEQRLCLAAGSMVMWSAPLWHRANPNTTDRTRHILTIGYVPFFVRPMQQYADLVSQDYLATCSEDVAILLGLHDPYRQGFKQPERL